MELKYLEAPNVKLAINGDLDLKFFAPEISFTEEVLIENATLNGIDLFGTWFVGGVIFRNCIFNCYFNWTYGGHNTKPVIFENCVFKEFANFEDCTFESRFVLRNVEFIEGTNLLGNLESPLRVLFEIFPLLENITGNLHVDSTRNE
ncbi:MAG: hypothetical protein EOP04_23280 [Proteobacteria bacterium]|nr:MAG: hypothetical protein EOP04_23280 [Pseudomonadota bacterium]